jgi:hypothetical protein
MWDDGGDEGGLWGAYWRPVANGTQSRGAIVRAKIIHFRIQAEKNRRTDDEWCLLDGSHPPPVQPVRTARDGGKPPHRPVPMPRFPNTEPGHDDSRAEWCLPSCLGLPKNIDMSS